MTEPDPLARASSGDLAAQRLMVLQHLVPRVPGTPLSMADIDTALMWARVAYANGSAEDAMRLVHVLFHKGFLVGESDAALGIEAEIIALLAAVAGDAPPFGPIAARQLVVAVPAATAGAADLARAVLEGWGVPTGALDAAISATSDVSEEAEAVDMIAALRRKALVVARVVEAFGLDWNTAEQLVDTSPGDRTTLATPEGWASVVGSVADQLGVEHPGITITFH